MYEICAFLAPKKTVKRRAARKPAAPRIAVGSRVSRCGVPGFVVTRRDTRYASAWFVAIDGVEAPHSVSRDMLVVEV
jgi:hypothetical protein